jgi:Hint domain
MTLSAGSIAFVALSIDDGFESFTFVLLEDADAGESITFHARIWNGTSFEPGGASSGASIRWTAPAEGLTAGTLVQIDARYGSAAPTTYDRMGSVAKSGFWDVAWGAPGLNSAIYATAGDSLADPNAHGPFLTAIGLRHNVDDGWLNGTGLADWGTERNALALYPDSNGHVLFQTVFSINRQLVESGFADPAEARLRYNSNGWWTRDGGTNDGLNDPNGNPIETGDPEGDALHDPNSPLYGASRLPVCFMPGTLIRTPLGEVPVESLRIGDEVVTSAGEVRPVKWIGRQTVSTRFADPMRVLPVRIRPGALAENVPSRDLFVSPDHALLVDGVLIQAGSLVNGSSIARFSDVPVTFTYYHVELHDHSLVLAQNTPAETFIDHVARRAFDNWAEYEALYPASQSITEMRLPRAKAARQVPQATRTRLAARGAIAAPARRLERAG